MDSAIKKQAQELFTELGMDMTTAVNIFLRQAIQRQGLPFEVTLKQPNAETLEALADEGGDTSTQQKDIAAAISIAKERRNRS